MDKKYAKKWNTIVLVGVLVCLFASASLTIIIDPVFHYRAPRESLSYYITEPRYYNDGIGKHFSYNALITGTSMTQRFHASEFEQLWNAQAVKLPYPGAGYQEIGSNIMNAISANTNLEYVLWGLDTNRILGELEKDAISTTYRPEYLYDNCLLNDVEYLFNKDMLLDYTLTTIAYTMRGKETTNFDDYLNGDEKEVKTGRNVVLEGYERTAVQEQMNSYTSETEEQVVLNIRQYIEPVVTQNDQIQFYLFFTPYSIVWWDEQNMDGNTEIYLKALRTATEELLAFPNVKVYCFFDCYDMICDLDNYADTMHYDSSINSAILKWIKNEQYELKPETYNNYFDEIEKFYLNFEYDEYLKNNTD